MPPALNGLATDEAQASDEGEIAASGNDAWRASGSDTDFKVVCINNNNGGNATEPTATLAVSKTVTCIPNDITTRAAAACQNIAIALPPNEFNIVVTGNNPKPSEFPGSSVPVVVTLGAGNYEVTEEEAPILPFPGVTTTVTTNFSGDCTDINPNNQQSTEATGTIEAGNSQICEISNDYRTFFTS